MNKLQKLLAKQEELAKLKIAINLPLKGLKKIVDARHIELKNAPPKTKKATT